MRLRFMGAYQGEKRLFAMTRKRYAVSMDCFSTSILSEAGV